MDQCSGDSAYGRAGGDADPGWTAIPGLLAGTLELGHTGHLQSSYVSALPVGGGCEPSPTLSRSLGTSSLQLEPPRALPSTGIAGAGSRVCTERA